MTQAMNERVDRLFAEWDKNDSPGCALAVVHEGKTVYERGYGMANLEHDVPISASTVFDIGSTSKQFVAACVAMLAREKALALEDNIQKYLPEIPEYGYPVTIRHLIHHTSGLRDYLTLMSLAGLPFENDYPDEEILGLIARQKELNFRPGDEFLYCNSGYLLLAEIVKRVSGKALRVFAEEKIFSPLGMKSTRFFDDFSEIVKNRATGYVKGEKGFHASMSIFDVVGDGGVQTTVQDLFRWDQNFYNNTLGGYGRGFIDELAAPGKLNNGDTLDYAFGLFTAPYRGLKMICHGGAWMGYRAELLRLPEHSFSVICLSNLANMNPISLAKEVADIYLEGKFPDQKVSAEQADTPGAAAPAIELSGKAGFYFSRQTAGIVQVTEKDGRLTLGSNGASHQLVPLGGGRFKAAASQLSAEFKEPAAGDNEVSITPERGRPAVYRQLPAARATPGILREFAGDYYCPELDTAYKLTEESGKLKLSRKNCRAEELELVGKDLLKGSCTSFQFIRNEGNAISGFFLGAGRVKDLRFSKQNTVI